jgi:hypothetical protein
LKVEARGRKRFFRLAAPEVGAAVEALASASIASAPLAAPNVFKRSIFPAKNQTPASSSSLRKARICHDHLGGEIAADLYQRLLDAGWIEQSHQRIVVTHKGASQLATRGIFIQALAQRDTPMACSCPDWSERRPHLGGALGAGLLQLFMQSGWLNLPGESRALQITAAGQHEIAGFAKVTEMELVN